MAGKRKKQANFLRNNMSFPEILLWQRIQNDQLGFRLNRQLPIGTYILDFYCGELRVAIEVDGGHHAFRKRKDAIRDQWLASQGVTVYRIPARLILENSVVTANLLKRFLEELKVSKQR